MRRFLLFFVAGVLLIILQTTFLHLLPIGPIVPDLTLVMCVYLGINHPTVGSALGSFLLGYSVDVVSSRMLGANAFAMSLVFFSVYLSSRSIWLQHPAVSFLIVLLAAMVKGLALVLVWVLFLSIEGFWTGAMRYIFTEALLAAALAPLVFSLLRRGEVYMEKFRPAPQ